MRKLLTLMATLALITAACGEDATNTTTTSTVVEATTSSAPTTTTTEPPLVTCRQAPGDQAFEEVANGAIEVYPAGRYRADQFDPMSHFTIADDWSISDFNVGGYTGFSGLRPEALAAEDAEDPFVAIWPVTAWYDLATDTNVVFPPGELAARVQVDPRLTDVTVTEATVGSCPAIRVEAMVLDEYQDGEFWLGASAPRDYGDTPGDTGNVISDAGDAAEHVVFWAIDVDGIDLLVNATYPTDLADRFEPMLEALIASTEFE